MHSARVALLWVCAAGVLCVTWDPPSVASFFHAHTDVTRAAVAGLVLWLGAPCLYQVTWRPWLDWTVCSVLLTWLSAALAAESFCAGQGCAPSVSTSTATVLSVAVAVAGSLLPLKLLPGVVLLALTALLVMNERRWDPQYFFALSLSALVVVVAQLPKKPSE